MCDLRDQRDKGGGNEDADGEAKGLHFGLRQPGSEDGAVPLQVEAYPDTYTVHVGVTIDCADGRGDASAKPHPQSLRCH